jgi:hypothetical protein
MNFSAPLRFNPSMNIQTLAKQSPLLKSRSSNPLKSRAEARLETEETSHQDSVQFSRSPMERAETGKLQRGNRKVMSKLLAGVGLGVVAMSLVGCGGGETPPAPPANQTQQQPQQSSAATYTARMDQLRSQSDKTGYHQMAEAGYHLTVLQRFAKISDPAARSVQEIAQKGVEAFDFKADPAAQQKLMRDVMKLIAETKSDAPEVVRYTQAAQATLTIGQAFSENAAKAPGGIVAQLKNSAYEQGLKAALTRLKAAPDQLKDQSGYDPALIRNYVESLSMGPEVALEFAPQLNDTGLSAVLYEQTGEVLYQRAKADGQILGSQVTAAMELLQSLRR